MDKQAGQKVFRRVRRSDVGELKLSGATLNLLMEFDGKSHLTETAARAGIPLAEAQAAVALLITHGLVEPIHIAEATVPADAFEKINALLLKAIGPVGGYLLDEVIADLGQTREKFPLVQLPELVEVLSQEIGRPEVAHTFKQQMIQLIKALTH